MNENYRPLAILFQSIRKRHFLYIDSGEHLADRLFAKHQIRVKFTREYIHNRTNYRVIFCKIPPKDVPKFEQAMAELTNNMLLLGHNDYLDFCQDLTCWLNED